MDTLTFGKRHTMPRCLPAVGWRVPLDWQPQISVCVVTNPVGQQCRTARKSSGVISIPKTQLPSRRMDVFTTLLFKYWAVC